MVDFSVLVVVLDVSLVSGISVVVDGTLLVVLLSVVVELVVEPFVVLVDFTVPGTLVVVL